MTEQRIELFDRKYVVILRDDGGAEFLRHGEKRATGLSNLERALADRVVQLQAGLDLALLLQAPYEPGDSRAVSDHFVAMASLACDRDTDGKSLAFVRQMLALGSFPPMKTLTIPNMKPEDIEALMKDGNNQGGGIVLPNDDAAKLYFEAHITIEPVFDARRELAAKLTGMFGFKLADLLMKKRAADTEERSAKDTFMTGHGQSLRDITQRLQNCVKDLQNNGFKVWRYKIEDTILDSRTNDVFGLIAPDHPDGS